MGRTLVLWPRNGLWRHADFLKLWSAETISQFGTQVSGLAIPLAAIIVLHASAFEVASLNTVQFLPFLLFALPAGVWVDRLRRRLILVLGDLGRALALATIPLTYGLGALTIWQLYAVGFAVGTLTVFFDVSYQSYLPSLVTREHLVEGNSKLEVSRSAAQIGGPGLGGALVGLATAPYAILLDAASFLGSAAFIFSIRKAEPAPEQTRAPSMKRELWEGLRYLVAHRYWRPMSICVATSNFFNNVAWSILLVFAVRRLHLSPELIGLVLALGSLGALAGAVTAGRIGLRLGIGPTIVASSSLIGLPLVLVGLAPASFPYPFLIGGFAIVEYGIVLYNITAISLMQTVTPEHMLGRLNASRRFIVWGVIPLGSLVGGALASQIGLRPTILVGAIGASLAVLPVLLSPVRSLRAMPEPEELPAITVPFATPTDA
jgi:MFS family permease